MLVVIFRSIIIFLALVIVVRLMGKRTIGELQPYEFVITLAIADLAAIPIQDVSISIFYGLVPLAVIFLLHYAITFFTTKSIRFRKFLNGKPQIIIDGDGIVSECLTKLCMNVNDLLAMIRQQGYFSIKQIKFGVIETNGKLSIMPNEEMEAPQSIPTTLVVEGKIVTANLVMLQFSSDKINKILSQNNVKLNQCVLMTADSGEIFIQPRKSKFIIVKEDEVPQ